MNIVMPVLYALIAAIGNAVFAYAQKKSSSDENGLLIVGISALIAFIFSALFSPLMGDLNLDKLQWKNLLIGGGGLFITYLGFYLLYSRFGVSQYVLYAVLSIITTTIIVGVLLFKEPVNIYHKVSIVLSIIAVVIYSIGEKNI